MNEVNILILVAVLTGMSGVAWLVSLSHEGAGWLYKLIAGLLVCNIVFNLVYPLSGENYGVMPYISLGLAFLGWLLVRFLRAKDEYPIGGYRGTVLRQ